MKRANLYFAILLLITSCVEEKTSRINDEMVSDSFVNQERALLVAKNYYLINSSANSGSNRTTASLIENNVVAIKDSTGTPGFYIVEYRDNGFVIVSADRRVYPILAFSESSSFPMTGIPSGVAGILNTDFKVIQEARSDNKPQNRDIKTEWEKFERTLDINLEIDKQSKLLKQTVNARNKSVPPFNPEDGCNTNSYEEVDLAFPMKWNQNC